MAEDTTASTTPQAGERGQPQAGDPDTSAAPGQEPTGTTESQTFDAEYVKKLRAESASHRTKLANAEKRLQELEQGQLSETQKLQKQLEAAHTELETLRAAQHEARAMSAAAKANAKYPDAVARLIAGDTDDYDAAVKEVRKNYPDLFRPQMAGVDGGAGGNGAVKPTDMNSMIRKAAGRT